jgi:hypothetical protein
VDEFVDRVLELKEFYPGNNIMLQMGRSEREGGREGGEMELVGLEVREEGRVEGCCVGRS